jgi:iron complex outermembrane receptor protein
MHPCHPLFASAPLFAAVLVFIAVPAGVLAQDSPASSAGRSSASSQTGSITGRVKNAVTDQSLNNARISVVGTEIVEFTGQDGSFRIVGVPSGPREILVEYTGLDPQRIRVDVSAAAAVERDVLLTSVARYGTNAEVVKLDRYKVTADRELNAQTVATNEQRFAANIKTALAADSFGSLMANSVGEFMKFIPGVAVSNAGNANEITEFSVRGIGGAMSSFTQDGAPMVFGSFSPASRIFNPYTSDINSAARIEVTKAPRPSDPADSIGGSVNLVSKSAFDHDGSVGHFNLGLNVSGRFLHTKFWRETPVLLGDRTSYKALPNGSFDYSLPISKNFGVFVSGLHFPKASLFTQMRTPYQMSGAGTGATASNPFMGSLWEFEGPRTYTKTNLSFKADWRVTQYSTVSFNISAGENKTLVGNSYRNIVVGASGLSSVPGGTGLTYGNDFTSGATGRGTVQLVGLFQEFNGATTAPSLTFRHDDGRWRIEGRASYTNSYMEKDNPNGNFANLNASLRMPVRVSFTGLKHEAQPAGVQIFGNNNNLINLNDIANYKVDSASEIFYRNKAKAMHYDAKVNRRLAMFPFPSSIEIGGAQTTREYQNRTWNNVLTYNGPDGVATTEDPIPASFLVRNYHNTQVHLVGGGEAPFLSPDRVWEEWIRNPNLFTMTPAQVVAKENTRRRGTQDIEEVVDAAYIQGDARLFSGRLHLLGGVRFEKTTAEGAGVAFEPTAVWERNADGTFARTPSGARIRRVAAGAVGSMEELVLTTIEGGAQSEKSYNGYFPSVHLTYNIRDNLLARATYASTFGRPDYSQIIPGATITEADLNNNQLSDPNVARGTITVNNTGLKPWLADNFDLSLEYYSRSGGLITVGVFLKNITDFFGAASRYATQTDLDLLGLDSRYLGWTVNTRFNSGDARVRGVELNFRQPLSGFGEWGKYFSVFANGTKLKLDGANDADFSSFTPETANWGFSFGRNRVYAGFKWNYTGEVRRGANPAAGPGGYFYFQPVLTTDLDLSYGITPRLTVALSVANLTNDPTIWHTYSSLTPDHARHYMTFTTGSHWVLALKGTF